MAEAELKSSTSRKLEILDALSIDPMIRPNEFQVAFRLLQHANAETGAIFLSQARIALQIGMDPRSVRRCVNSLISKGWLTKSRANRQKSNSYTFAEQKVEAMRERQTWIEDEARAMRERTKMSPQKKPDRTKTSDPDRTRLSSPEGTEMTPKHLKGTPEGEHLNSLGYEQETFTKQHQQKKAAGTAHQHAGAKQPFSSPEPEDFSHQPAGSSYEPEYPLRSENIFRGRPISEPDFDRLIAERMARSRRNP